VAGQGWPDSRSERQFQTKLTAPSFPSSQQFGFDPDRRDPEASELRVPPGGPETTIKNLANSSIQFSRLSQQTRLATTIDAAQITYGYEAPSQPPRLNGEKKISIHEELENRANRLCEIKTAHVGRRRPLANASGFFISSKKTLHTCVIPGFTMLIAVLLIIWRTGSGQKVSLGNPTQEKGSNFCGPIPSR
jgi:hypothetical protein